MPPGGPQEAADPPSADDTVAPREATTSPSQVVAVDADVGQVLGQTLRIESLEQ